MSYKKNIDGKADSVRCRLSFSLYIHIQNVFLGLRNLLLRIQEVSGALNN
jgi:hypothetical protein